MNGRPINPSSISDLAYCAPGVYRKVNPSFVFNPFFLASPATRRVCVKSKATGFSHRTCFPASIAADANSRWALEGVTMSMTSMSVRLITDCQSPLHSDTPCFDAISCARVLSTSQTTTTSHRGSRFQPGICAESAQAPAPRIPTRILPSACIYDPNYLDQV